MDERPFYFPSGSADLFSILHSPVARPGGRSRMGYVFCAPLGEEQVRTRRIFTTFARELAQRGFWALRFDYRGEGDSGGQFEEATLRTRAEDVDAAISELRRRAGVERVGIVGLRWGGALALLAARQRPEVEELILWAPVVDLYRDLYGALRANLATQTLIYREIRHTRDELLEKCCRGELVNLHGFLYAWPLFQEASEIDLLSEAERFRGRALVVDLPRSVRPSPGGEGRNEALRLHEHLALGGQSEFASIEREFSWEETPVWNPRPARLFAVTGEWIEKNRTMERVEHGMPRPISE
jgi:pimeloyl-ACP methyl ester carboxylesterase